jgi:hypothetical protein
MLVLVATRLTQGDRRNDYHWAMDGELVRLGEICRKDRKDPDGGCGCGRGFAGMSSRRATTTARVADLSCTRAEFVVSYADAMREAGWDPCPDCVEFDARELLRLAASWPEGTVVGRRLDRLVVRMLPEGWTFDGPCDRSA